MQNKASTWAAALFFLSIVALAGPRGVRADCMTPEPLLLWSYPADGARDVPTNALFWFVSSQTAFNPDLSATLNGKPLVWPQEAHNVSGQVSIHRVHVDPGPLQPSTAYTLVLHYASDTLRRRESVPIVGLELSLFARPGIRRAPREQ